MPTSLTTLSAHTLVFCIAAAATVTAPPATTWLLALTGAWLLIHKLPPAKILRSSGDGRNHQLTVQFERTL